VRTRCPLYIYCCVCLMKIGNLQLILTRSESAKVQTSAKVNLSKKSNLAMLKCIRATYLLRNLVIYTTPYYGEAPLLRRFYEPCVTRGSHSFIATHTTILPLLPICKASPPFGWYSIAPTHEGMARLSWSGWLETYRDTSTHLSNNRARSWLTSLIDANALTTTPGNYLWDVGWTETFSSINSLKFKPLQARRQGGVAVSNNKQ